MLPALMVGPATAPELTFSVVGVGRNVESEAPSLAAPSVGGKATVDKESETDGSLSSLGDELIYQ